MTFDRRYPRTMPNICHLLDPRHFHVTLPLNIVFWMWMTSLYSIPLPLYSSILLRFLYKIAVPGPVLTAASFPYNLPTDLHHAPAAAISCNHQLQQSAANISCKHQLQQSAATISWNHQLQPSAATIICNHQLQLSAATISCNHQLQPSAAIISCNHQLQPSFTTISCNHQLTISSYPNCCIRECNSR